MADMQALAKFLFEGNQAEVIRITKQALGEGISPSDILSQGLIKGMDEVGARFQCNEIYVPEVLIAARAMQGAMAIIKPLLTASGVQPVGRIVIGTVKGDMHDIGKNLVGMMMEGAGFEVIDLGVNVTPEQFVNTAKEKKAQLIGMSALLTTTMPRMRDTVQALAQGGLQGQIKTLVGGAPLTQKYADDIKADGFAPDAASAVQVAKRLIGVA